MASICKVARAVLNISHIFRIGSQTYTNRKCSTLPCNPSVPTMYDCRKYSPCLPKDNICCLPFEPLPCVPSGVFRYSSGEILGPCANKCGMYKQTEYFSYHNMTFYDFHYVLQQCRLRQPDSGRKP